MADNYNQMSKLSYEKQLDSSESVYQMEISLANNGNQPSCMFENISATENSESSLNYVNIDLTFTLLRN
jgi:hypothetical protein